MQKPANPSPGTDVSTTNVSGVRVAEPMELALPSDSSPPGSDASPHSTVPARRARARVLLIEDDVTALAVSARALSRIGYAVTACLEASEGVRLVETNPRTFDVVVANAAAAVSLSLLHVPLVLTAYSGEVATLAPALTGARSLQKPFTALELSEAIDNARADFPRAVERNS